LLAFFFAYSHNLVKVYMQCDYTYLNQNSLVSQKKVIIKGFTLVEPIDKEYDKAFPYSFGGLNFEPLTFVVPLS
jgi:hypothetical protein